MTTYDFRLVRGSMGSFLDPPNSPQTEYEVQGWYSPHRTREPDVMMSLEGALESEDVSEGMKRRIRRLYEQADMQPTEEWLSQVYGYFKNCYSPDGEDRNVSHCLIVTPDPDGGYKLGPFGHDGHLDEPPPIEHSLAVMHVRKFFPDHEPRTDLLQNGRWGK